MVNLADIEALKDRGAGYPAPSAVVRLYDLAFQQYTIRALWSWRHVEHPTIAQALAVAQVLIKDHPFSQAAAEVKDLLPEMHR